MWCGGFTSSALALDIVSDGPMVDAQAPRGAVAIQVGQGGPRVRRRAHLRRRRHPQEPELPQRSKLAERHERM